MFTCAVGKAFDHQMAEIPHVVENTDIKIVYGLFSIAFAKQHGSWRCENIVSALSNKKFIVFRFCLCMFSELRTCLHNRNVAFVGDSRTRGLYYHLVQALSSNAVKDEGKAVSVLVYSGNNVTMKELKLLPCKITLE